MVAVSCNTNFKQQKVKMTILHNKKHVLSEDDSQHQCHYRADGYCKHNTVVPNLPEKFKSKTYKLHREEIDKDQLAIKKKIEEYVQEFTIHGLTKVFHHNRVEAVFWSIIVVCGLLLTTYVTHGLFRKYLSYKIYTEVRSQVTRNNYFPAITICDVPLLKTSYFAFCGLESNSKIDNKTVCNSTINNHKTKIDYIENQLWSNKYFRVTYCGTWGGEDCLSTGYFISLTRYNNSCMQFNYNGNLSDVYSHVIISFDFIPPASYGDYPPDLILIPQDYRVYEIDLTNNAPIESEKKYSIVLEKTVHQRLPHPFPSNCSDGKPSDIFPGKYGRRQCLESQVYMRIYKECGAIFDYIYQYLDPSFILKYRQNKTIAEHEECFSRFRNEKVSVMDDCPFPCTEEEYAMSTSFVSAFRDRNRGGPKPESVLSYRYQLEINYRFADTYKIYEEKVLYDWDQLASEVGGFVGLVIGASVISIVEILVCIVLKIVSKWKLFASNAKSCLDGSNCIAHCKMCGHTLNTKLINDDDSAENDVYELPTERFEICSSL